MAVAQRCLPADARHGFGHWGALLAELHRSAFGSDEPGVRAARLGWWGRELAALRDGGAAHPLSEGLPAEVPWQALVHAFAELASDVRRPSDGAQAIARMQPLAEAIVAVETTWFGSDGGAVVVRSAVVDLLSRGLQRGVDAEAAGVPMHLFARHSIVPGPPDGAGAAHVLADWAAELRGLGAVQPVRACAYRQMRWQLDHDWLRHVVTSPLAAWRPGPASAWHCWKLARRMGGRGRRP